MYIQEQAIRETEAVFGPLRERIAGARERLEGLVVVSSTHLSILSIYLSSFFFFFSFFEYDLILFSFIRFGLAR